jgi:hypothetical protein
MSKEAIRWDRPCYKCLSHYCDLFCKEPALAKQEQGEPDYKTLAIQLQQQRTWVGLTNEERNDLYEKYHDQHGLPKQGYPDGFDYERAIEAKLRSKNENL